MSKIMTIGLKKRSVQLVEFNPAWRNIFEKEKKSIEKVLLAEKMNVFIEHVGSTSVIGLCAKPIIDIALGFVNFSDVFKARKVLRELGYDYIPVANRVGMIFLAKGKEDIRYFHIHMVRKGSLAWCNLVVVRDYLRRNKKAAQEYAKIKIASAKQFSDDRIAYAQAKNPMIDAIAQRALVWHDTNRIRSAITHEQMRNLPSKQALLNPPLAVRHQVFSRLIRPMAQSNKKDK